MSLIGAASHDKMLIRHLADGGSIVDSVSKEIIEKLIKESLENDKIAAAVSRSGLPLSLLIELYQSCFSTLLPQPLILHGSIILVPSLPWIDEDNFPGMLNVWCAEARYQTGDRFSEYRLFDIAIRTMLTIRDKAAAAGQLLAWPPENYSLN